MNGSCGGKCKTCCPSFYKTLGGDGSVWKQMTTQKGIFTWNGLLPVIRHVDGVLLDKLARQVVLSCSSNSGNDVMPAKQLRIYTESVKLCLPQLCKEVFTSQDHHHGKILGIFYFRLAEKPLLAWRR